MYCVFFYCARPLIVAWCLNYPMISNAFLEKPRYLPRPSSASWLRVAAFPRFLLAHPELISRTEAWIRTCSWYPPVYTVSTQAQPHPARGTAKTIQNPLNWFCMVLQHHSDHNEYGDVRGLEGFKQQLELSQAADWIFLATAFTTNCESKNSQTPRLLKSWREKTGNWDVPKLKASWPHDIGQSGT